MHSHVKNSIPTKPESSKKLEMITSTDEFTKGEIIGGGCFSRIFEGTLHGIPVAIKVATVEGRRNIHKEIKIYRKVQHPHLLPALGFHLGIENMLFLSLRNLSLRDYCHDYGRELDFLQLKLYCIQISDAMKYLHNKNILHCDLKIDNILIKDEKGQQIEICSFDCAVDLKRDYPIKYFGTTTHTAYEILKHVSNPEGYQKVQASKATDIWAFAVTMWQIFQKCDKLPQDFIRQQDIVKNYETGKKLPIPTTISEDFWFDIFLQCFDLHPTARPSFEDLYHRLLVFREDPDM